MDDTIFIAGILQFQSKELFQEALESLRAEKGYAPDQSLIAVYEEAMVNDTILVLRHTSHLKGSLFTKVMDEAYALVEFAGKGYLAGVLRGKEPRIKVAMAAMAHPIIDKFSKVADPDLEGDFLPRSSNLKFEYEYRSEGRDALVDWNARNTKIGQYDYISFPHAGADDPFNDWWDGHYYLKSGAKWFAVTTDLDAQALAHPAEEEIQLIMDGEGKPGDIHFTHVPGTESFRIYVHEGFEDVEVPFGEFSRCMKTRVDLYFLPTAESRYTAEGADKIFKKMSTTHYFGKGVGLVKLIFESGELLLAQVSEADILDENATESANSTATEENETPKSQQSLRKPPWWKFW